MRVPVEEVDVHDAAGVDDGARPMSQEDVHHPRPVVDRASFELDLGVPRPEDETRLGPEVGEVKADDAVSASAEFRDHVAACEASPAGDENRPGSVGLDSGHGDYYSTVVRVMTSVREAA